MRVFAPVSIGNFSVGFDLLGLSIAPVNGHLFGDIVSVKHSDFFDLSYSGPYADALPKEKSENLVRMAYDLFMDEMHSRNLKMPNVKLHLDKRLPVGSGLGSSSSSIVATLYALNHFCDGVLEMDVLLQLAGKLEGQFSGDIHYDNVAPCLLGGLQLMTGSDAKPCVNIPFPDEWQLVVSYPGIQIATKLARSLLTENNNLKTCVKFAQNLSVFTHAMHNNDHDLAASVLFDVIAEPQRKSLIPGFDEYKNYAKNAGALAFGISGSGSTVFAVTNDPEVSTKIQEYALNEFCRNEGFSHICKVDNKGVRQINDEER